MIAVNLLLSGFPVGATMKQSKIKAEVQAHLPNKNNQIVRLDKCTQIVLNVQYITLLTNGDMLGKVRIGGSYTKVKYDERHANWRLL